VVAHPLFTHISSWRPSIVSKFSLMKYEDGEALEQVAQGGCGCPIPGGIQGQAGCGSGQPGLLVGDPARGRGLKLNDHCGPFQPRLFYDSMKYCNCTWNIKNCFE